MKALHNHPPSISQSMSEATPRTTETRGEQSNTGLNETRRGRDETRRANQARSCYLVVTTQAAPHKARDRRQSNTTETASRQQAKVAVAGDEQ